MASNSATPLIKSGPYDFDIAQGDTYPHLIVTLVHSDGTIPNLTGKNVQFLLRDAKSENTINLTGSASILNATSGMVQYAFSAGDTIAYGLYEGQFVISDPLTQAVETYPNTRFLTVNVARTIGQSNAPSFTPVGGPRGIQGVPGPSGGGFSTTLASGFAMPAAGSAGTTSFADQSAVVVSEYVTIAGLGTLQVSALAPGLITLYNPSPAIPSNASTGTAAATGVHVASSGPPGPAGVAGSPTVQSASLTADTTLSGSSGYTTLATVTTVVTTHLLVSGRMSGINGAAGTYWMRILVDGSVVPGGGSYTEGVNSGAGFNASCGAHLTGLANTTHTVVLQANSGPSTPGSIHAASNPTFECATLTTTSYTS